MAVERITVQSQGPAGPLTLEAVLRRPEGTVRGGAVLVHPHPAFGGHMDVWLLPAIARALAVAGWAVLRLNCRGVGGSTGHSGDGEAEAADARAGMEALDAACGPLPRRAVVGWSFGALVGLFAVCDDDRFDDWVGIAPPTRPLDGLLLAPAPTDRLERSRARRSAVVGSDDQFFPAGEASALAPGRTRVIEGADHFFFDRDPEVAAAVLAALEDPPVRHGR